MNLGPQELLILGAVLMVIALPVVIIVVVVMASNRKSRSAVAAPQAAPWPVASPVVASQGSAHPGATSVADQLREIAELRDQGILTEAEFEAQKARILA